MIKEQINKDYMVAFKEKNTIIKNLLSVVKGEIQTIEKNNSIENLPNDEVIKILNKTVKSLKETINTKARNDNDTENIENSKIELAFIEKYLPQLMSREDISEIVKNAISNGNNNIGLIMKEFNSLPVDRKLVSDVIKELL